MNFFFKNNYLFSKLLVFAVIIITVIASFFTANIKFDYDFESFFPTDDKDLQFYLNYRDQFEYDNEFILVGLENKEGIFKKDFLHKVRSFTDSVKTIKDVTRVLSPSNAKNTIIAPLGMIEVPYLNIDLPDQYANDSAGIYRSEELVGSLFANDARSVALFIKTKEGIAKVASDTLLFKLERLIRSFGFDKTHVAGKIKAQYVYLDQIKREFILFLITSFILVVVFLYISFRSFWGVCIPIVVVLLAIVWVLGFMGFIHKPLDIMMVLLPTMMFVVGMSDVVHVLTKYMEELRNGKEKQEAFKNTLRDVAFPTFITLLSTGVGFLSLLYSSIKPIRDFGIFTSLGILVCFILAFTFLPALILLRKEPILFKERNEDTFWNKRLHRLLLWVLLNRVKIIMGTIVIVVLSFAGMSRIVLNNNLLEDIVDSNSLKQDFYFFEKHFSGVRPFEMSVTLKDPARSIFDMDVLQQLNRVEELLKKEYGVGFIVSPVTVVKSINKALNGGDAENYKLPEDTAALKEVIQAIKKYKKKVELKVLISPDEHNVRITGKMHDLGSAAIRELDKKLELAMRKEIQPRLFNYKLTGGAVMIDKNNEYLVYNMLQGLFMSVLVVSLIIAFIYRSFKIVLISLIPNIIPMILVGGLMGFAGIEMKLSTSIIFSIAFGIATDDTIHLLARLKLEMDKGYSYLYAIKRTYISTGKAVVVTSLILSAGFLTLVMSDFQGTFYFGLLVSVILLVAVITELLLLPLLLLWLKKVS
ncbi:MAG: RND family transporter [Bacteroidetes bacterium]|nr:RND family transporter [Bacteroidota bacterium]